MNDALAIDGFLIVGDVQHAPHESPIGFPARFHAGITVHGWVGKLVSVEAAFGTLGHKDSVFGLLCMHEPEHFGTEVFASIRPTQATTGNSAEPEVYAGYLC